MLCIHNSIVERKGLIILIKSIVDSMLFII
nr:MAG TPA: hypothetical protein [Caudoviricetes sp.]